MTTNWPAFLCQRIVARETIADAGVPIHPVCGGVPSSAHRLDGPHEYAVTGERLPASLVVERWRSASPGPTAEGMLTAVVLDGDVTLAAPPGS
jgi:hypothetical protein